MIYLSRKWIFLAILFLCVFWYGIFLYGFRNDAGILPQDKHHSIHDLHQKIDLIAKNLDDNRSFLNKLHSQFDAVIAKEEKYVSSKTNDVITNSPIIIPVIVFVYNRPSISRSLDLLLRYQQTVDAGSFPLVVSQDGNHMETTKVIKGYENQIVHLRHPDPGAALKVPSNHRNFLGYYKISSHYKWAISQTFKRYPHSQAVIIVEDDLEIAPDFFSYFFATYDLLIQDTTLYCISAWNDNGKQGLIDEMGTTTLYRSDFFPGLGWMLKKSTWIEMELKWPPAFWDDWIRQPGQRKGRACIRPEISRTKTFGRIGVSNGQFYDQHLKYIKLNDVNIKWNNFNLSYLQQEIYDRQFVNQIYNLPAVSLSSLQSNVVSNDIGVRIEYSSAAFFKTCAKTLGLMDDFKSGVPRTAYHGIVSSMYNAHRVYLAPTQPWGGYDETWT